MPPKKKQKVKTSAVALASMFERLSLKRKRVRNKPSSVPAGYTGLSSSPNQGSTRIKNNEYWSDCVLAVDPAHESFGSCSFLPGKSGLQHLDNLAKVFERYILHSATVHFRTRVGTSKDGAIICGIDWDGSSVLPSKLRDVAVKSPSKRSAIWNQFDMPLPSNQLMAIKIRPTASSSVVPSAYSNTAFDLVWAIMHEASKSARTWGEIWLTYDVTFQGPRTGIE